MAKRNYVEVCFSDSDRSSSDACYYPEIVVGNITFTPEIRSGRGYYNTKEKANRVAAFIASKLGIEAKLLDEKK